MTINTRNVAMFGVMAMLFIFTGVWQSWSLSLAILNLCLISAIMALGVNIQWGYAGLLNVGVMGFAALGGLAGILVASPPVPGAWEAGGLGILLAGLSMMITIAAISVIYFRTKGSMRFWSILVVGIVGYFIARAFFDP
ncbi:MAG: branched-chain amino acid ABC transporter permease, partial [Pseudomonadota bacterium]